MVVLIENTLEGWEARLKPRGIGRFFEGGFLIVWLCFWTGGEIAAFWFLAQGVISLLTGRPMQGMPIDSIGAMMGVFAFLGIWLTLWTFGGIAATTELVNILWAEDILSIRGDILSIQRQRGPFRKEHIYSKDDILEIDGSATNGRLFMRLRDKLKTIELTRYAVGKERDELVQKLSRALKFPTTSDEPPSTTLPEDWMETRSLDGLPVLVKDPAKRRKGAKIVAGVAFIFAASSVRAAWASQPFSSGVSSIVVLLALTVFFAYLAWRLHSQSEEWTLEKLRMRRRNVTRIFVRELFSGDKLVLQRESHTDGGNWYRLALIDTRGKVGSTKSRAIVVSDLDDTWVPRRLGLWIAGRTGLPFEDCTTPDAERADITALKTKLLSMGWFGRRCAGLLPNCRVI